ncbi:MAG: penicillin-binding protein activator [Pseudomonadota bacterium]|nr:penicillin-binding protein activator [Pseudomonadota bacterium]
MRHRSKPISRRCSNTRGGQHAAALLLSLILASLPTASSAQSDYAAQRLTSARTLEDRGQFTAAIVERLWAHAALDRLDQRDHNAHQIWRLLQRLPSTALNRPPDATPWTAQGWWALARAHRQAAGSNWDLSEALQRWEQQFPDHPARDSVLRTLRVDLPMHRRQAPAMMGGPAPRPQRIAVVAPTTGALGGAGQALVDGLLEASRARPDISLRLFDSAPSGGLATYQAAAGYRPDLIIGPLDKSAVERLAQQTQLSVPTLALNYGPRSAWGTGNLWQFGLAPEDDAAAAAEQARARGLQRAAVLFADDDWGRRVGLGFLERFEALGGRIVRQTRFWPGSSELQDAVRHLLQPDAPTPLWQDTRPGRLAGSRQVDLLFLAAKSRDARLIVPLLRFHHAVDLPIYAPDAALGGRQNAEALRDLDRVMLCGPRAGESGQTAFPQFHALGHDAFAVANQLPLLTAGHRLEGQTGQLSLESGGRIARHADCSRL